MADAKTKTVKIVELKLTVDAPWRTSHNPDSALAWRCMAPGCRERIAPTGGFKMDPHPRCCHCGLSDEEQKPFRCAIAQATQDRVAASLLEFVRLTPEEHEAYAEGRLGVQVLMGW